jgi:hypothetical protein
VLPRARGGLETLLRKLAPAVFLKLVRPAGIAPASPDWHSGILLLNDDRERSGAEPWLEPCATYDRKERTPLPRWLSVAPAGCFTADVSVFTGTPPTKPLALEILEWGLVRSEQEWA